MMGPASTGATLVTLLIVAATFTVAGMITALVLRSWRAQIIGGPYLKRPSCARCRMVLKGVDAPLPERCPECGAETSRPGAVDWVETRGRSALVRAGQRALLVMLVVVCTPGALMSAAGFVILLQRWIGPRLVHGERPPPPSQEARLAWARGERGTLIGVDAEALRNPSFLPVEEMRELAAALLATPGVQGRYPALAAVATTLADRDPASIDDLRARVARRVPPVRVLATPQAAPSSETVIMLVQPTSSPHAWMAIEEVRVNGEIVDCQSSQTTIKPGLLAHGVSDERWLMATCTAPAIPGTYTLDIVWSADWPLREASGAPRVPGIRPEGGTERRTLIVTTGPALITARTGSADLSLVDLTERPYLVVTPSALAARVASDEGALKAGRVGVFARLPIVPARFDGRWEIRIPGTSGVCSPNAVMDGERAWMPLTTPPRPQTPLDVQLAGLVPDPAAIDPDEIRVRFLPSVNDVTVPPPTPIGRRGWPATPERALDAAWADPIELVFRLSPSPTSRRTYLLDRVERLNR